MKVHLCSFQSVDTPTPKTDYAEFRAEVLMAGRFSAFEASANNLAAGLFTKLCRDKAVRCTDLGYPWTKVEKNEAAAGQLAAKVS